MEYPLYLVYADTYTDDPWGVDIAVFGIFSTNKNANLYIDNKVKKEDIKYRLKIKKLPLDKPCKEYLGGYIE